MSDSITDPRKLRLIDWMVDEKAGVQDPKFFKDLAPELGVDERTLHRWKKDPEVDKRFRELLMANAGPPERFAQVVDAMFAEALDSSSSKQVPAAKWLSDVFGLAEQAKQDAKPKDQKKQLLALSAEDLDRLAAEVLAEAEDAKG